LTDTEIICRAAVSHCKLNREPNRVPPAGLPAKVALLLVSEKS